MLVITCHSASQRAPPTLQIDWLSVLLSVKTKLCSVFYKAVHSLAPVSPWSPCPATLPCLYILATLPSFLIKRTELAPTSGPLHSLVPLPGIASSLFPGCLYMACFLPSSGLFQHHFFRQSFLNQLIENSNPLYTFSPSLSSLYPDFFPIVLSGT